MPRPFGAEGSRGRVPCRPHRDSASVDRAIRGCSGVFSVQDFYQAGLEGEVRQGTEVFALELMAVG